MEVETRVELFNQYFGVMVETLFNHRGTLDKYIGSTIMAVFNSPLPLEDHALMAIKTALAMQERLAEINNFWFPEEHHPLRIGIGINTDVFSVVMWFPSKNGVHCGGAWGECGKSLESTRAAIWLRHFDRSKDV
jgi:class 3 adenylate cyclase